MDGSLRLTVDDVLAGELAVLAQFKLLGHGLFILGRGVHRSCFFTAVVNANQLYEISHLVSPRVLSGFTAACGIRPY